MDKRRVMKKVNERDDCGETALHRAARCGDALEVKNLISLGARVNTRDSCQWTPLHLAVVYNSDDSHLFTIELLLRNGANVNAQDWCGNTPLYYFIIKSTNANLKSARLFLDYKVDTHLCYDKFDGNHLLNAVENSNFVVVQLLMNCGSEVNTSGKVDGSTPLHAACLRGSVKIIKCLVKNGANTDAKDFRGRSPLMCLFEWENQSVQALTFLLKYSNVNTIDLNKLNILDFNHMANIWKIILQHIAKLKVLNQSVNQSILKTISQNTDYKDYFMNCVNELTRSKNWQLKNSWISFFDLLVDSKKKIKNYAGNKDLISGFRNSGYLNKFVIYGQQMQENVDRGIKTRELFDKASMLLSYFLPMLNPNHRIIRDILDCINSNKDLEKLL